MDALTLDIQDEHLVGVLGALEGQLLREGFVCVWSEHHVHCLSLTWLQGAVVRPDLEPLSIVVFAVATLADHAWLGLLGEGPVAGDLLVVLKSDLDRLASVDADAIEVEGLRVKSELGDRNIGNELDRVFWSILDVNGDLIALLAELGSLPRRQDDIEVLAGVRE